MKRVIAALNEPRTIHEYVTYARFSVEHVAADAIFAAPRPPSADLLAGIAALEPPTRASLSRTVGTKAKRLEQRARVHQGLTTLRCHLQEVAVQADTTLRGYVPATRVFLRYRTVTKAGVSDWSDVVSLWVV
jgi:hypothetical protein